MWLSQLWQAKCHDLFSGEPISDQLLSEKPFPNVQTKLPLKQLYSICVLSLVTRVESLAHRPSQAGHSSGCRHSLHRGHSVHPAHLEHPGTLGTAPGLKAESLGGGSCSSGSLRAVSPGDRGCPAARGVSVSDQH